MILFKKLNSIRVKLSYEFGLITNQENRNIGINLNQKCDFTLFVPVTRSQSGHRSSSSSYLIMNVYNYNISGSELTLIISAI